MSGEKTIQKYLYLYISTVLVPAIKIFMVIAYRALRRQEKISASDISIMAKCTYSPFRRR
jgi:hypothetical protein